MKTDIPRWLLKQTFAIQYNPNCPSPFLVRLVRPGTGGLDYKQHMSFQHSGDEKLTESVTHDILGYGQTIEEAAKVALAEQKRIRCSKEMK